MTLRRLVAISAAALVAACSQDSSPPAAPGRAAATPAATTNATPAAAAQKLVYPVAKTVDQIDDYHGTKVADPYRWMEDLDSPDLATWIEAENKVTQTYLADTPRAAIKARTAAIPTAACSRRPAPGRSRP